MAGGRIVAQDNKPEISSIDRLFINIGKYRNSKRFKEMLDFYGRFPYLGVYNAALVEQQLPGARFVATAETWKDKYSRKIKLDARPVIILMPFYPVDFLFEISDTEPEDDDIFPQKDDDLLEAIKNQFKAETTINSHHYLDRLYVNLPKHGIFMQPIKAGSELAAKLQKVKKDERTKMYVKVNQTVSIPYHNYYTIGINSNADEATSLANAFHELGHFFCHHLPSPDDWWKQRNLDKNTEEFEAEIVSYLVCERMGIKTNSEQYLAGYIKDDSKIPPIRIENIFYAVDEIEKILKSSRRPEDCLLYKNDKDFQELVKKVRAEEKAKKEAQKNRL